MSELPAGPVLVIAHPGHELRIWEWVTLHRPVVFILTDGSGGQGEARIGYSKKILLRAGATLGDWCGAFADREVYDLILQNQVERLAAELQLQPGRLVVGDLAEGYNTAHDLCRAMINAAVDLAAQDRAAVSRNLAFPLMGDPGKAWEGRLPAAGAIHLDETRLEAKLEAARGCGALRNEVEAALKATGKESFATEYLFETPVGPLRDAVPEEPPFYETFGEKRVAEGSYQNVIRYRGHMLPLFSRIRVACGLEA